LAIATAAQAQAQAQAARKDDYDDYDSEEDDYFLSDVGDDDADMSGEEMLMYVFSQKRL
jgi:hypothetical protein